MPAMSPTAARVAPTAEARDLCIALAVLALLMAWDASGWDLAVSARWGRPGGFP